MAIDDQVLADCRQAFDFPGAAIVVGAPLHAGVGEPEPIIRLPLAMMTRHGLVAGATGTGKTKTLQLLAERLSAAGVPSFVADVKGDLSGLAAPGAESERTRARALETGDAWAPVAFPVEFLSLTGARGARLRAAVSTFGPLLLAKVLGLNDTQTSALTLVFQFCDDRGLELVDFTDLRAVLEHLTGPGADELRSYGGISRATVGVLLREMVQLEQQGALRFFGEPDFEVEDLLQVRDGRGVISVLELADVQDKPALFSTFLMWMLARLYNQLPEVGDLDRPRLVFFFDEAHLLFNGASKAFLEQVETVVRLIRSKGVGIFFVTQSPKDVPAAILGQLGNRVQHALRAFTADDQKALRAAARTFPRTPHYDLEETLTSLGIGEALVTVLTPRGTPSPPFATRISPPASRMAPLEEGELRAHLAASSQVRKYEADLDPESAAEKLGRSARGAAAEDGPEAGRTRSPVEAATGGGMLATVLGSSVTRSLANTMMREVTRGIMGALLGPRRRTTRR